MSSSEGPLQPVTEVAIATGGSYRVEGEVEDVERIILDAARGSLMEFAWLVDAETGERVGVNPEHVVMLRAAASSHDR